MSFCIAQDLPLEKPALDYVLEKAREDDTTVTLEKGRKALGALGLTGSMALRPIGPPRHLPTSRLLSCVSPGPQICKLSLPACPHGGCMVRLSC